MNTDIDVFSKIVNHMVEGMMFHDQMYRLFLFLRLYTFAKNQKKRYREESKSYQKINKYFITHRNKLIKELPVKADEYIPGEWYSSDRMNASPKDVRDGVIYAISAWINWEKGTKELYTNCYNKLIELGFAAESGEVMKLVKDVDEELAEVESLELKLHAMDYDVIEIMNMNE